MNNTKIIWCAVVVVAIIALIGVFSPQSSVSPKVGGATTNLNSLGVTTLYVGSGCSDEFSSCSGTGIALLQTGTASTCTASSSAPANKSVTLECAVSGLLSTDKVFFSPGAALSNVSLGLTGVYSSTTANGFLEYSILNASTSAITTVQNDVRNVEYLIIR